MDHHHHGFNVKVKCWWDVWICQDISRLDFSMLNYSSYLET